MNDPWYTRRPVTRFLGITGCIVTLIASCHHINVQEERDRYRGDQLVASETAVRFSEDGQQLFGVVGTSTPKDSHWELRAWETSQGRLLWRHRLPSTPPGTYDYDYAMSQNMVALAISGKHVAVVTDKELALRSTETGRVLWRTPLTTTYGFRICFSPSGKLIALSEPGAESVRVFDVETGRKLNTFFVFCKAPSYPLHFLADGSVLVAEIRRDPKTKEDVTLLVARDPLTGATRRRIARDVVNLTVSPKADKVLITQQRQILLTTPTGKVIARHRLFGFDGYSGPEATFWSDGVSVRISDNYQRSYLWNPARVGSSAITVQDIHRELLYFSTTTRAVRVSDTGGLGSHEPLGTLVDSGKTIALEGQTGWEL
jgi:PQQ-like domain